MRFLITILLAILLFTNLSLAAENTMQKAWGFYLKGDYNKAIVSCRIAAKDKALGEEGRYLMGLSFLKLDNTKQARENFQFVLETYPRTDIKEELLLGVADSFYAEENFESAEIAYKELLREFPRGDYSSIVYLRLGIAQRKQGKWRNSEFSLHKVLRDYPLSLEAKDAKQYLKKENYFSVQVGAFSKSENASQVAKNLKAKGYDGFVEKSYDKDKLIYRVKVGKFKNEEEAKREEASLKLDGFSSRITS